MISNLSKYIIKFLLDSTLSFDQKLMLIHRLLRVITMCEQPIDGITNIYDWWHILRSNSLWKLHYLGKAEEGLHNPRNMWSAVFFFFFSLQYKIYMALDYRFDSFLQNDISIIYKVSITNYWASNSDLAMVNDDGLLSVHFLNSTILSKKNLPQTTFLLQKRNTNFFNSLVF